jgi:FKBP-type peptidyl-prolyl cis-trans isomerase SlyD
MFGEIFLSDHGNLTPEHVMKIADNCVVSIHYTLTDDDGEEIDSSEGQEPLSYLHGAGNVIMGLEDALTGRSVGDHFEVVIQPEDGYGEFDEELVQSVPRDSFVGIEEIEPGMQFQTEDDEGEEMMVTVQEVTPDEVIVDGNHPLAGVVLHFDVTVTSVRAATEEEIDHGHAHGEGGHHH